MKRIFNWYRSFRVAIYHASYHRNMKRAEQARTNRDVVKFKEYIYKAEDAWRKIVLLTEKSK